MEYACGKCGRVFGCEMEISFCPFCGSAYEPAADQNRVSTMRIAIGSDSERRVQEKYWYRAQGSLRHTLALLDSMLPDESGTFPVQLDLEAWLSQQRSCRSSAQFQKRVGSFLERIHAALQDREIQQAPAPIDLPPLAQRIEQTCAMLMHTLGEAFLPETAPRLVYEPVSTKAETKKTDETSFEPYRQLLLTIEKVRPVFDSILDENGVFVALVALETLLDEEDAVEPLPLIKQLSELAQKDYDPLFGEEYDDFVLTFWKSILCTADAVNRKLALPERDENEQAKMEALQDFLSEWQEALSTALDRLYESQTKSMIAVCKELEEIEKQASRTEDEQGDS